MRQNCWYTTQPMETTHPRALEITLEMINAESQLLFSSDWPHYDFDLPAVIYDLPLLSEQAKRNILGLNAAGSSIWTPRSARNHDNENRPGEGAGASMQPAMPLVSAVEEFHVAKSEL